MTHAVELQAEGIVLSARCCMIDDSELLLRIPASVPEEFEEKMLRDMRGEPMKGDDTK